MTNADKFLKDGVDIKEFSRNMFNYLVNRDEPLKIKIENFLKEDITPTLTEDERVILRNINNEIYTKIGRDVDTELYIAGNTIFRGDRIPQKDILEIILKPNLFQFIKERRRIFY